MLDPDTEEPPVDVTLPGFPTSDQPRKCEWTEPLWYVSRACALKASPELPEEDAAARVALFANLWSAVPCPVCEGHYKKNFEQAPFTREHARDAALGLKWIQDLRATIRASAPPAHSPTESESAPPLAVEVHTNHGHTPAAFGGVGSGIAANEMAEDETAVPKKEPKKGFGLPRTSWESQFYPGDPTRLFRDMLGVPPLGPECVETLRRQDAAIQTALRAKARNASIGDCGCSLKTWTPGQTPFSIP